MIVLFAVRHPRRFAVALRLRMWLWRSARHAVHHPRVQRLDGHDCFLMNCEGWRS